MSLSPQVSPLSGSLSDLSDPEGEEGGGREGSGKRGELIGEVALEAWPPGAILAVLAVPLRVSWK